MFRQNDSIKNCFRFLIGDPCGGVFIYERKLEYKSSRNLKNLQGIL
ncbi:hypothetical protein LEP1GSC016_4010 [Leptospira borgpetersenii serovar Hardjo-bovis str. Sponselee]|uniref:Uncharacterized protein n=1 Tax=Leptospira borgpetersenii serovar Hardjo-bovis str. Sponselee TaxID=1303729 RepID=M6BR65_LEPBO|nr:hypothetical protein LEP1GSC016_4010 [Leptospira borgpetersenii serovar Hardjo-bovis str. Sponselee]